MRLILEYNRVREHQTINQTKRWRRWAIILLITDEWIQQIASRSDVIKIPANLQNQTKISFILGVVSTDSKLLVFVKRLKCFGIFFTLNLM